MDLLDAVINQDQKELKHWLEQGVDLNMCEDCAKVSPLHYASQGGSFGYI